MSLYLLNYIHVGTNFLTAIPHRHRPSHSTAGSACFAGRRVVAWIVLISIITVSGCKNHHTSDANPAKNSTTDKTGKYNNLEAALLGLRASAVSDRLKAIQVLRDLNDGKALRPLITTAAKDENPKVREAAAMAVLRLAEDPEYESSSRFAKRLMRRIPEISLENVEFSKAVSYLAQKGHTSVHVRYEGSGVYRTTKISIRATDLTLAEAWCRLIVASESRLIIRLDDYVSLVPERK